MHKFCVCEIYFIINIKKLTQGIDKRSDICYNQPYHKGVVSALSVASQHTDLSGLAWIK